MLVCSATFDSIRVYATKLADWPENALFRTLSMRRPSILTLLLILLLSSLIMPASGAPGDVVRIGVLAHRGEDLTLQNWVPTAEYLEQRIPDQRFRIVTLDFERIGEAVERGEVEFVVANSAIYVELEALHGVARIATMRNRVGDVGNTRFGGVIFTAASRDDVHALSDLRGKRFGAVMENSFGGWLMARLELRRHGIEASAFRSLAFLGTHDAVVAAVLDGRVDAGTVRSDTLERMADAGRLDLARVRVLAPRDYPDFDYLVSTELYPEWPIARVRHAPEALGHAVALALMQMPADSPAAIAGGVTGWTVPHDYQPVHDLMRELRVGPYADLGRITLDDLWVHYRQWVIGLPLLLLALSTITLIILRLNRRLRRAERDLIHARDRLTERVAERTAELERTMRQLEQSHQRLERISRDWNDAFDAISDPIFIHDRQLRVISANPAYCRAAGKGEDAVLGQRYFEIFPRLGGPLPACAQQPEQLNPHGDEIVLDNGDIYVSSSFAIVRADGSAENAIHILKNVTGERMAEREMKRLNRALRTLSLCNTSLVHAEEESALLVRICEVLIDSGGYHAAWVAYPGLDDHLIPATHRGHDAGLIAASTELLVINERVPAVIARDRGEIYIEREDESTVASAPGWRQLAREHGVRATAAFPLLDGGTQLGVLVIHSAEGDAFDEAEMRLLRELAGDLAFGIATLRGRLARTLAETSLAATEARYEALYENAPSAYCSITADQQAGLIQFNQTFLKLTGQAREALFGQPFPDLFPEKEGDRERVVAALAELHRGEAVGELEVRMNRSGGEPHWVSLSMVPVYDDHHVGEYRASLVDIHARKQAEADRHAFAARLQRSLLQTIRAIALTIEKRDPYTAGHQERVADLAVLIARRMGLEESRIEGLRLGALIHDIGKITVPSEILNRPGRLDPALFAIIKVHPSVGHEIIGGIDFPWPLAEMVVQHHERLDGSGYPHGLQGDEILLESRILAVADVVEAMASHRPYRAALGPEAALAEIRRGKGTQYDASVVEACESLFADGGIQWIDGRLD